MNLIKISLMGMILILCPAAVAIAGRSADDPLNVVATLTDLAKIAEAVGGDKVKVTAIASGVQDPHFVDAKPSYVVKLRDADLFLVNGLELEIGWVPPLLDGARNPKIKPGSAGYVDCSRNIPVLELPVGVVTRAEGDVHPFGNPHYTTDPLNANIIAETVADALKGAMPSASDYFDARKKAFQKSIDEAMFGKDLVDLVGGRKLESLCRSGELDGFLEKESQGGAKLSTKLGGWLLKMRPLKGQKMVFYHKSYTYFIERFGLDVQNFIELKPGIQPGPGHLVDLVTTILREKIRVVATHPFYDEKVARLVAEKGGARLVLLPLLVGGIKGTEDQLKFFDIVTSLLVEASGK
ncbi:MAG TPA: metal ABC transporter substrate-binding protein [Planctomycetota bacterium]|nr:metal ABC transporter substrate-binding protein [Planctomycetota bacterium]